MTNVTRDRHEWYVSSVGNFVCRFCGLVSMEEHLNKQNSIPCVFDAAKNEPMPQPGTVEIAPLVLADIQARIEMGRQKYGTTLQANNSRDCLMDAYQEAIDLVMYLRQVIAERDGK